MRDSGSVTRAQRLVLIALVVADILLAAAVGARFFARLDLSRNRMYTLSSTSKRIVGSLPEQLSVTYYVSDKLRGRYPFPAQIEDLLNEYATYARGKMTVTVVDPSRARRPIQPEQLGIVAQQMQVVEREEINLATVYSGIVVQYLDRSESLPFVADLSTLEYDLSSKIRAVVSNKRKVVGILLGDSQKSLEQNFRSLQQELSVHFPLRPVEKGKEISPEISVLFLIGNKDLDEADMFPVDQFIMRGGRVLFAVNSVDVNLAAGLSATVNQKKAAADMLAGYGVRVRDELVLDALNQRISFRVQANQFMVVNYPHWVTVADRYVAKDNPITSRFAGLDLYWPCALEVVERPGVKAKPIVSTTPEAWTMQSPFETNPALSALYARQGGQRSQLPLAVTLSGTFSSYFSARPLPTRPGEAPPKGPLLTKSPETRIVVVGDADFASDMIQYTQAAYNMSFLSNCAEWLSQEDDLLAIKTRAQVDTRLARIQDPARKAAAMRASQVLNVALVPLCVVAAGVVRLLMRGRKKLQSPRETK